MDGEKLALRERGSVEDPAAMLAVAAFQKTPWERTLRKAAVQEPSMAVDVFKGLTGLYWAYADTLPKAQTFAQPTRELMTELAASQSRDGHPYDRGQLLSIAEHLMDFTQMWYTIQPPGVATTPSPQTLSRLLHIDAARHFNALTFTHEFDDLHVLAHDLWSTPMQDPAQAEQFRILSRHLSTDPTAPPVTVGGNGLSFTVGQVRERYKNILALPDFPQNETNQQLMWELLGTKNSAPHSLRELLLGLTDEQADTIKEALKTEFSHLTNTENIAKLYENTRKKGRQAVRATTQKPKPKSGQQTETTLVEEPKDAVDLWTIIDQIKEGGKAREEALGVLYAESYNSVYRFILFKVRNIDLANDLTATVYERAVRRINMIENRGVDVRAWLVSVARNLVADHFKSGAVRLETIVDANETFAGEETKNCSPESPWRNPEAAVVTEYTKQELKQILHDAISQITAERQRHCLYYRYFEELTIAQTAEKLGATESAVKVLQYNAMRNLRIIVQKKYPWLQNFQDI